VADQMTSERTKSLTVDLVREAKALS